MFLLEKKVPYTVIFVAALLTYASSFCSDLDNDSFAAALAGIMDAPLQRDLVSIYPMRCELKKIADGECELETETRALALKKKTLVKRVKNKNQHQEIPRQDQCQKPKKPYRSKNKAAPATCISLGTTAINPETRHFQCAACLHNPWVPMNGILDHFNKHHRDVKKLPMALNILNTAYTSLRLLTIGIHYSIITIENPKQYQCLFCQKIYTNANHLAGHINTNHLKHLMVMKKYEHALTQKQS